MQNKVFILIVNIRHSLILILLHVVMRGWKNEVILRAISGPVQICTGTVHIMVNNIIELSATFGQEPSKIALAII